MHYSTAERNHGMKHDPFKALITPRPIGWVSTISKDGVPNLAPYSFFNGISDRPPMVMFSSAGRKDTLKNIEANGEFVCSMATHDLCDAMNISSAPVEHGVSEFKLAGLKTAESKLVLPPRVADSPAALECKLWKLIELPVPERHPELAYIMVIGSVVGVYIDDRYIKDGIFDTQSAKPIARMGYMDYAVVTSDTTFTLNRPTVVGSGQNVEVKVESGPWDGVYR